jgi:hypothetical protein
LCTIPLCSAILYVFWYAASRYQSHVGVELPAARTPSAKKIGRPLLYKFIEHIEDCLQNYEAL